MLVPALYAETTNVSSGLRHANASGQARVGLVLGAGGILGGAWVVGALHAIASETGWDPGSADFLVGTSAGAMIGALMACGVPPWFMVLHSSGEEVEDLLDARGEAAAAADRSAGATFQIEGRLPLGPGSWRLALASLARPYCGPGLHSSPISRTVRDWRLGGRPSSSVLVRVPSRRL
jgi:hypothetical protein